MKMRASFLAWLLLATPVIDAGVRTERPSASTRLATEIEKRGFGAALKMIPEFHENPEDYEFDEQDLDELGNRLLEIRAFEPAMAVLGLNAERFPQSWHAHFSLACACMFAGDRECAKQSLEIVINRNPTFWLADFILSDLDARLERVAEERELSYRPGEQTGLKGPYLGQEPPGLTAEMFAPGFVSKALALNFSCTFSLDGKTCYFNHFMTIMVCHLLDDGWTVPEPAAFAGNHRSLEPHISPDGKNLYFHWFRPTPREFDKDPTRTHPNHGMYVCHKTAQGWSQPAYLGYVGSATSTHNGEIFVSERRVDPESKTNTYSQIKRATIENGMIVGFESLGGKLADLEGRFSLTSHPCISPDGRKILFDTSMKSGLYAAFLIEANVWSDPVNLSEHGLSPNAGIALYSPDGEFVFFSDGGDIYWISAEFVEGLRPTEF